MARSSPPARNQSGRRPAPPQVPRSRPAPEGAVASDAPVLSAPVSAAVGIFERAMTSLQDHDYRRALADFEDLAQRFSNDRALLDRARVYAVVCQRGLNRLQAATPVTVEERLTAATAALNDGDNLRAEHLVSLVIDEAPAQELGHYLLAVVHARRGATAAALDALSQAVALSPEVRAQARHDVDFEGLRGHEGFEKLIAGAAARSGTRR